MYRLVTDFIQEYCMATRLPTPPIPTSESDPFSDLEQQITLKFNQLIEAVMRRREQLLTELRALRKQYTDKNLEIVNKIEELETSKNELTQHCSEMRANVAKVKIEKTIQELQQQIDDLKMKIPSSLSVEIELSCDTQKLEQTISDLGEICVNKSENREEKVLQRDYSLIKSPLFKASNLGRNKEQLKYPFGLYIDNSTDLVYIADRDNRRIQVWRLDGDYVSTFGEIVLKNPYRITLTNKALFVTDNGRSCVFKFQLSNFSLLARSDFEMVYACAICSSTDEVFVVDDKNIILVLSTDLKVLKSFTASIERCYDIKIKNSILYALEFSENEIKLLESNTGNLIRTVTTNKDGVSFQKACHFCLDQNGNFLITDWSTNQFKIIAEDGTLLRLFNTSDWELVKPQGIEVSNSNKIVLAFGCGVFCQF